MYIKYSTRKFKEDHLRRIKFLKAQSVSQGGNRTQEEVLVIALEIGLTQLEQLLLNPVDVNIKKRTAPMGIRNEE